MPKYTRKNRKVDPINYEGEILEFLQGNKVAFIPDDQRDSNRYHWHCSGEELGVATKTLKLWQNIPVCGRHNYPIIGLKPSADPYNQTYSSDYECDYEDEQDDDDFCYKDDEYKFCKMRTVIIFNKETSEKIKNMNLDQIKDFLVEEGFIKKVNSRYTI